MTGAISAIFELIFASITLGVILILEIALWRSRTTTRLRWIAGLFGLSVCVYVLCTTSPIRSLIGANLWLRLPLAAFVSADIAFYALLVSAIFEDHKLTWRSALPSVCLFCLGPVAVSTKGSIQYLLLGVYLASCIFLLGRSLVILLGGWPSDLDDARRRMRRPIIAATFMMALSASLDIAFGTATRLGLLHSWLALQREAAIAFIAVFVASQLLFTHLRPSPPRLNATDTRGSDSAILLALNTAMTEKEIWRQEGLTLKKLCLALDFPEYRVRRIILTRLGYRNFPAFINFQRVEAAKLKMKQEVAITIAETAFDVGFTSLSAFNRAFRDVAGESPTNWRRRQ